MNSIFLKKNKFKIIRKEDYNKNKYIINLNVFENEVTKEDNMLIIQLLNDFLH